MLCNIIIYYISIILEYLILSIYFDPVNHSWLDCTHIKVSLI